MKDQYVGDVNDYLKYALLRELQAGRDGGLTVCWLLTELDGRPDGSFLGYLDDPDRYRPADPELFDSLGAIVGGNRRSLRSIEDAGLIPRARFYSELLPSALSSRSDYFKGLSTMVRRNDLVFFDPDNGFEIKRPTSKHVLWSEVVDISEAGHSVLVYQHNTRNGDVREQATGHLAMAASLLPEHRAVALRGPRVMYLLIASAAEERALTRSLARFAQSWAVPLVVQQD
jgi:hypothetical protein